MANDSKTVRPLRVAAEPPPETTPDSPEERLRRIEERAYYLAEKRGFEPGHEEEDWHEAERQIDAEDAEKGESAPP